MIVVNSCCTRLQDNSCRVIKYQYCAGGRHGMDVSIQEIEQYDGKDVGIEETAFHDASRVIWCPVCTTL